MNFSERPGAWERRLQRMFDNPLFPPEQRRPDPATLEAARDNDRREAEAFTERLGGLVGEAMALETNVASERILDLKARVDRAYVECAGLAGDQGKHRRALQRLADAIMEAVARAAAGDPLAEKELEQEAMARRTHYRLLEQPLVADLMRPDSPLAEEELVPALLSESAEAVDAALWLFDAEQLATLCHEARTLLSAQFEEGLPLPHAWERLRQMERELCEETGDDALN